MNKKGFTLVEVLVSLALVSTIAIFLFQIIFIIRDIYAEKNIKSEIYIESSNVSNVINKDIFNKDKDGIYIKNINKVSNDELYITYSDGTKNNIVIDRSNNTITYGNYTASILDVAKIGNIEMYYNYETTDLNKNGICYIKIPITHDDYKNDFGIVITYRYNSSRTKINGEITIVPGGEEEQEICNIAENTSWTFEYTGNVQNFTAPCNGYYKLEVWGAQGGSSTGRNNSSFAGGKGGYSVGTIEVNNNDLMYVNVGGTGTHVTTEGCFNGGYNGGGTACASQYYVGIDSLPGTGGGATDIRINDNSNYARVIVAGGGAGGHTYSPTNYNSNTGVGGGLIGQDGSKDRESVQEAKGGTQVLGGTGGRFDSSYAYAGSGSFGQGGSGLSTARDNYYLGSGGGGGWYGGGGGGHFSGAGGSGWIYTESSYNNWSTNSTEGQSGNWLLNSNYYLSNATTLSGNQTITEPNGTTTTGHAGNGYAKITYIGEHLTALNTEWTFSYTGNIQTFNVPETGTYKLEVWGAQGGSGDVAGGKGGYSSGNINLTGGTTLYVGVGGQGSRGGNNQSASGGYNGGGSRSASNGACGSGGGATHIGSSNALLKDTTISNVYIVAGGGGGSQVGITGGVGGGINGGKNSYGSGEGGTQTGGNAFGVGETASGGGAGGGLYGGKNLGGGSGYIGGVTDGQTIAGNAAMPTHDGASTMTGNTGNGYAKITLVSY